MDTWQSFFAGTRKKLKTPLAIDIWDDLEDRWGWFFSETKSITEEAKIGPNVSIKVDDKKATVEMELAGYSKKDVSVTIDGQVITVSGTRAKTSFSKTFKVEAERFDMESVRAVLKDGLLTVTVLNRLDAVKSEKRTVPIQ